MLSLRTKDREEAKRRIPVLSVETDRQLDEARQGAAIGAPKTARQTRSAQAEAWEAAREAYALEASESDFPDAAAKDERREVLESGVQFLEQRLRGRTADLPPRLHPMKYLYEHNVYEATIAREQLAIARSELARLKAGQQPVESSPASLAPATVGRARQTVPLIDTFDAYASEQRIKHNTRTEWRAVIQKLIAFIGHDDAARITVDDLDRWRDSLLSETTQRGTLREPRTVRGGYP